MLDFAFFITSLRKQETGIRSPSQLGEGNEAPGRHLHAALNRFQTVQWSKASFKVQGKNKYF